MSRPVQETRFEYKGFPCVVLFMPLGYRCGYVGLPKGNKFYMEHYDEIPVECHGGLTYSDTKLSNQNDEDVWWIGYDCGHWGDGYDREKQKEYYGNDERVMGIIKISEMFGGDCEWAHKTLEYCIEQCKGIVDQLQEGK